MIRNSRSSKPAISKHLKVLEEFGVVRVIHGRNHRLSLGRALDEAAEWKDVSGRAGATCST